MKVEYLVNFSQYFENFTKAITGSYNKTILSEEFPKDWLSLMRCSNLKSFSFMC